MLTACETGPRKARSYPCQGIRSEMAYQQCVANEMANQRMMNEANDMLYRDQIEFQRQMYQYQ